jgi:hypothetical protein
VINVYHGTLHNSHEDNFVRKRMERIKLKLQRPCYEI